jgi:hypothetical protein
VKELAADIGEVDVSGVFVFEFDQAAAPAAIAQALPFPRRHFVESFGPPERLFFGGEFDHRFSFTSPH